MLIYEAIKKDHDELKPLLAQLVKSAKADDETRAELIEKIRDGLIPHSRAEEAVFYNSLRSIEGTGSLVAHSYAEHAEADALLRTLQTLDALDVEWTKVAMKLKEGIEHHITEEEGEVFAAAKQVLAPEEAEAMAEAFEAMKPEIKEGSFVGNTVDLLVNAMPARFAGPLREFMHRP